MLIFLKHLGLLDLPITRGLNLCPDAVVPSMTVKRDFIGFLALISSFISIIPRVGMDLYCIPASSKFITIVKTLLTLIQPSRARKAVNSLANATAASLSLLPFSPFKT